MDLEAGLPSADATDDASGAVAPEQPDGAERPAIGAQESAAQTDAQQLTGAAAVAARLHEHLDAVDSLAGIELGEHVEFYQRVHGDLQSALKDIDDA